MSIFFIAKIIGIIILILLSLIIILAVLLLFAPFRYKIDGSFIDEKPDGTASVGWLLSLIKLTAEYHKNEKPKVYIKLFGIKIYDIISDDSNKNKEKKKEDRKKAESNNDVSLDVLCGKAEAAKPLLLTEKTNTEIKEKKSNKHKSIRIRLKILCNTIYKKIQCFIKDVFRLLKAVYASVKDKTDKLKCLYELYHAEKYQSDIRLVKKCIIKLIGELKPTKGHGFLVYGSGDPYSTGRMMEAAALLYPVYYEFFEIKPDFESSRLDAALNISGRIRLIFIGMPALRIYFNKNIRDMYAEAKRILETDKN